jgi:hypothetical protein
MTLKSAGLFQMGPSGYLGAAALGGGIGVGTRLVQRLRELASRRDIADPLGADEDTTAGSIQVPVKVSPAEAAELAKQNIPVAGYKVKQAMTIADGTLWGAVAAGAGIGGYKLLDRKYDDERLTKAKTQRAKARMRVQKLLEGSPEQADQPLYTAMKLGSATHVKQAFLGDALTSAISDATSPFAPLFVPLGAGGVLLGMSAYNQTKDNNKHELKIKALRKYLRNQPTRQTNVNMVPVLDQQTSATDASTPSQPVR